jgi:predicted RNA-binding Zn ribbon-like protein
MVASRSSSPEVLAREELSIKFVNTVAWRLRHGVEDRVASPDVMLKWLSDAGLADGTIVSQLKARWKAVPREGRAFLKSAVELREAIYRLFIAGIDGRNADPAAARVLNMHLSGSAGLGIGLSHKTLAWQRSSGRPVSGGLLKPIAWSAAGLLTGPHAQKIKQCQDERGCGWLFVDESRAQNRRWCSMGDCGNLAKSRRHYRRAKTEPLSRA